MDPEQTSSERSPAAHGYVLPLDSERRDETGTRCGLVGAGGVTHCKNGHPFDEANTHIAKSGPRAGRRTCIACRRAAGKRCYWKDVEHTRARQKQKRKNYVSVALPWGIETDPIAQWMRNERWTQLTKQEAPLARFRVIRRMDFELERRLVAKGRLLLRIKRYDRWDWEEQRRGERELKRAARCFQWNDSRLTSLDSGDGYFLRTLSAPVLTPLEELIAKEEEEEHHTEMRFRTYARRCSSMPTHWEPMKYQPFSGGGGAER